MREREASWSVRRRGTPEVCLGHGVMVGECSRLVAGRVARCWCTFTWWSKEGGCTTVQESKGAARLRLSQDARAGHSMVSNQSLLTHLAQRVTNKSPTSIFLARTVRLRGDETTPLGDNSARSTEDSSQGQSDTPSGAVDPRAAERGHASASSLLGKPRAGGCHRRARVLLPARSVPMHCNGAHKYLGQLVYSYVIVVIRP